MNEKGWLYLLTLQSHKMCSVCFSILAKKTDTAYNLRNICNIHTSLFYMLTSVEVCTLSITIYILISIYLHIYDLQIQD